MSVKEAWMKDRRAILIQSSYDEEQLLKFAYEKIERLQFSDWGDFYAKMSQEFIYEDNQ